MKKILILANSAGGLVMFRGDLIRELLKENEIICVTPFNNRYEELREMGCRLIEQKVDRRGISFKKDFALFRNYWRIIRQEKPDYVICYTIKPNIYGGAAARMAKIPYAVNVTGLGTAFDKGGLLKKFVVTMYKYSLARAKVVFFENAENRDVFVKEKIVPADRTCVLNGAGVNLDRFVYLPYPKEQKTVRFLFMGRIMKEKGVEELFSSFRKLHAEGFDCTLDVLGHFEENYRDTIAACETEGWLKYHGFQKDVKPFIQAAHCFVLPSWHEGMANTNLECAASGRPIITSNIPGCKEAVVDGVSGLLCEPKNADSLYAAIKTMLAKSMEEREKMGLEGRKHMEKVFDKQAVVRKTLEEIYSNGI